MRPGLVCQTRSRAVNECFVVLLCFCAATTSTALFDGVKKIITDPINKVVFNNRCTEDLGCFYTGPPFFHPILRPISLLPSNLEKTTTKFWLFTPKEKIKPYNLELNESSVEASTFDPSLPTKFLIHGYLSTVEEKDARHRMKDALLEEGNYNVIIVDWTTSNGRPYFQAVANTRVVGAEIARLVDILQKTKGINPQSVHLIGHSLGSHIAGYAGERISNLGRISGVDPAGPYFSGTDKKVRLDPSDAEFVDVIHTNIGHVVVDGLGMVDPIGDVDFYPNGGEHQPLCKPVLLNVTFAGVNITAVGNGEGPTALMATSCDHNAGNEYYIASIKYKNCTFFGTECDNYEHYESDSCGFNRKAIMGFAAQRDASLKPGSKFYLKTADHSPYCIPDTRRDQGKEL